MRTHRRPSARAACGPWQAGHRRNRWPDFVRTFRYLAVFTELGSDHPLQAAVLFLALFQALQLRWHQAAILLAPPVIHLLRNSRLPAVLLDAKTIVRLLQNEGDLLLQNRDFFVRFSSSASQRMTRKLSHHPGRFTGNRSLLQKLIKCHDVRGGPVRVREWQSNHAVFDRINRSRVDSSRIDLV